MVSSALTLAFRTGWTLSASVAALMKNGSGESLTPSRCRKPFFALLRSCMMRVTSTSTTVVSWADTLSESTMCLAIALRTRVIGTV